LRGTVAYPDLVMPLIVGREKSIRLVDEAMSKDKMIAIITQKNPDIEDPGAEDLYTVGTVATIMKMVKMVDGSQRVVIQGLCRCKVIEFTEADPNITASILPVFEDYQKDIEIDAMYINLKNLYRKAIEMAPYLSSELAQIASNVENLGNLADLIASTINISVIEKRNIGEDDLKERLKKATIYLNRSRDVELSTRSSSSFRKVLPRPSANLPARTAQGIQKKTWRMRRQDNRSRRG